MNSLKNFSNGYRQAREKFRAVADANGYARESQTNPNGLTPDGEPLTTEIAWTNVSSPEKVLFLISGTHGVEGYCGAGCLTAALDGWGESAHAADTLLVAINLLNPYGASWFRRVDENNVDVNRNFIDHAEPPSLNSAYQAIHPALVPESGDTETIRKADSQLARFQTPEFSALYSQAFTGQYQEPNGIMYGGNQPAWSNGLLIETVRRFGSAARHIALVDYHSGMGPYGYGMPIVAGHPNSEDFSRARAWLGGSVVSLHELEGSAEEQSEGVIGGSVIAAISGLAPWATVTSLALEFGTYAFDDCIPAMRDEAMLHLHGDPLSLEGRAVSKKWLDVFYPEDPAWREMVWLRSQQVIRQLATGLAEL
jgi:hypothetical protein